MNDDSQTRTQSRGTGLVSASFLGLLFTQLLTAVNDNIFRWLVIGIGKDYVDASQIGVILTAGTACFVTPYLLLAAPAGYLADRFSKRTVIIACKVAEIVIMTLGIGVIWLGNVYLLFAVVALMGAQSALFSPSKLGIIPEMLRSDRISAANGLFGLTTVAATVIGMGVGNALSDATGFRGQESLWMSAAVLIGVAVAGTLISLGIRLLPPANPQRKFPWDIVSCTIRDLRALASNRALLRVALGIVFFWSVGALAQLNIDQFAAEGGALHETDKVPLLVALVFGVGFGSVLAGIWSAGRVELGILPLGAFGIALTSMLLFWVQGTIIDPAAAWTTSFVYACGLLFVLGTSAGLFSVPLESYMQYRSPQHCRGAVLAATNFLVFNGVLISSFVYMGLRLPYYEGSLANVSEEMLGPPLTEDAKEQLSDQVNDFAARWNSGEDPSIESQLSEVEPATQARALSELLWVELHAKRERGTFVTKYEYFERFPQQQKLVKAVYDQATDLPLMNSRQVFLIAGVCSWPVFVYIVWLIPQASLRFLVWLGSRTVYRVRVYGRHNLPEQGGALLVSNHVSWIDGVLLLLTSSRPIRMVVWSGNFRNGLMLRMADLWGAILISARPKQILRALRTARDALNNGELVCIFPEGGITRSGQLLAFRPGMLKILDGADAPVLPVYLDGLWGSIFSFDRGRFFWKWPRRWPYPIHIYFGEPIANPGDVNRVRSVIQVMGARAVQSRSEQSAQLVQNFIGICRRRLRASKAADSTGAELNGGQLLARTLVFRRLLRQHVLADDEQYVGVLLPPSLGGVVANAALAVDRRISVNLNYTVSNEVLNACIEQAAVRHVLTSRRFMEKMDFELDAEVVYLEDLREKTSLADKLVAGFQAYAVPKRMLARHLGAHKTKSDDVITVIFTSGSTGLPKGVMLTHANVATNVEAVDQVVNLNSRDVLIGVLPFFHSFGYTITMWAVLGIDVKGVYHFNPLDAKIVGKICQKHGGTLLLATPTFLRTYARRCSKEQFETLDVVVTGAERLPVDVCDAFEKKFGLRPVEGYGTTELSPLVSVNVPPSRSSGEFQVDRKEGTVGRPIPGVAAKITDLDTGEELGTGKAGMLWITGPNVMRGYLGREDLTNEVVKDSWYMTGDVALVDEDGFIQITGRESRFSKIGGEMVPHIRIEEELARLVGDDDDGCLKAVVTAVPDDRKGERLIVVHTRMDESPEQLCKSLAEAGLPNLYIPSADSFFEIESLPMLGSGKLDLKGIKQIAVERTQR